MFAKSLCLATLAGMTAALKLTAKVELSSLAGVNIKALSKAELQSLMEATSADFQSACSHNDIHITTQAESQAVQSQWLEKNAIAATIAADNNMEVSPNNPWNFWDEKTTAAHAQTRTPAEPEHSPYPSNSHEANGDVIAEGQTLAENDDLWNTEWPGCSYTYQWIYDQVADWNCNSFEAWDDQWLQQVAYPAYYNYYVASGWITEAYLKQWWEDNIITWRETLRATLRCVVPPPDGDDDAEDDDGSNNGDGSSNDNCTDVNAESCVWGDEYVTPIKNQGSCGSCYAFSVTQILESYAAIANGGGVTSLSEQQIVDCQYNNANGCNGGWPASILTQLSHDSSKAIVPEQDYEYTASRGTCRTSSVSASHRVATSQAAQKIQSNSVAHIKQALLNGPLAVTVDANDCFMSYSGGVLRQCGYGALNHAVNIIGWEQKNGVEVLKVRNSWGTWWGDKGYIYICIESDCAAENGGKGPAGILEYAYYAATRLV